MDDVNMRQEVPGEAAPQQEPEETAPQESPPNNKCDPAAEDPYAPPAKPVYDGKFDMKLDLRARAIIGQFAARIRDDDPEYLATTAKHFFGPTPEFRRGEAPEEKARRQNASANLVKPKKNIRRAAEGWVNAALAGYEDSGRKKKL